MINFPLSLSLSSNSYISNGHSCILHLHSYQNHVFFLFFLFLFLRFKEALKTTSSPMKNIGNLDDFNSIRIKKNLWRSLKEGIEYYHLLWNFYTMNNPTESTEWWDFGVKFFFLTFPRKIGYSICTSAHTRVALSSTSVYCKKKREEKEGTCHILHTKVKRGRIFAKLIQTYPSNAVQWFVLSPTSPGSQVKEGRSICLLHKREIKIQHTNGTSNNHMEMKKSQTIYESNSHKYFLVVNCLHD